MKINEVETLVGITKKNIRFYEKEGLLAPSRNSDNGYREYGEQEVTALKQIKLLRKLGLPLEEIRQMQTGGRTVGDAMARHLVTLERDRENLEQAMRLCGELKDCQHPLRQLDADRILSRMETMEQGGTTFMNKQKGDVRGRYAAPALAAAVIILLMAALIALMAWAFAVDPVGAPPLPLLVVLVALPAVVILGVLLALAQRWKEIGKGEEDEARKY